MHYELSTQQKETPLWLVFLDRAAKPQEEARPHQLWLHATDRVEYETVLDSVVEELKCVADTLSDCDGIAEE